MTTNSASLVHVGDVAADYNEHSLLLSKSLGDLDEVILNKIREGEVLKERMMGTVRHIMGKIQDMFAEINKNSAGTQAEISALMAEIRALQQELRATIEANAPPPSPDDDLDAEFDAEWGNQGYSFSDYDESPDSTKTEDVNLVKLFRKIAQRTHPDRTDDPELHMLFVTAKEFRNKGDLGGLQGIWDFLTGQSALKDSALRERLDALLAELSMLDAQLVHLRNSSDFLLLTEYQRDKATMLHLSWVQMLDKRRQLIDQVQLLRQLAGKNTQTPKYLNFEC